jgi:hypothetical protein
MKMLVDSHSFPVPKFATCAENCLSQSQRRSPLLGCLGNACRSIKVRHNDGVPWALDCSKL